MRVDGRVAVAATMFALFAAMTAIATTFPAHGRLVPLVVGVPGLLLSAWQLRAELADGRAHAPRPGAPNRPPGGPVEIRERRAPRREEAVIVAWTLGFTAAVVLGGFLLGGSAAVLAFVRVRLGKPWPLALGAGAACGALLWAGFEKLLGLVLFEGLWLGG